MGASRGHVLLVLLALAAILLADAPGSWLVDPDETRYAEVAREMVASGDYVTPRLNGTAYWEKPPLLYWLEAGSFHLLGTNDYAARLPVRLAALGTALLLLLSAGGAAGPWAAVVHLSAPACFLLGRYNLTDGILSFFLALTLLLLRRFLAAHEEGRRPRLLLAGIGAAAAMAVLSKGLVGAVVPGLVLLAWAAILGRWRAVLEIVISPATVAFLLLVSPWFALVERANPGFNWYFFVGEHFGRFASTRVRHPNPPYYLLGVFVAGFLPWALFLPGAVRGLLTRSREELRRRSDDLWFALWAAVVLLFFTISRSRLATYVLPAFPAAALLVGRLLAREEGAPRSPLLVNALLWTVLAPLSVLAVAGFDVLDGLELRAHVIAGASALLAGVWAAVLLGRSRPAAAPLAVAASLAGLLLAVVLAFPEVARRRSLHDLAEAASREPRARVVLYDCYASSLPWVLGRVVPVAGYVGELASDRARPAEILWSEPQFWREWDSGRPLLAVVRTRSGPEFRAPGRPVPREVFGRLDADGGYALVANFGE